MFSRLNVSINNIFMGILETQEINNAAKSVGKFGRVGVKSFIEYKIRLKNPPRHHL